jgi:4-amino-4-deoxy-L-arabinose transferase-like glycosyltransferase
MADKVERAESLDTEKDHIPHARAILLGIVLLCIFVRMLWIETPVVRDEGVAGYVAMVWSRGLSPYSYPMAAENPPLAYLIYLVFLPIFGNTIIPARMINDALYVVSIVVLYLIAKDWYNEKVGLITAFFYGFFMNAPIFETQLAIPSSLSIPFIIFSVYSFSVYLRKSRKSALFLSGILISLASLILQYQAVGIVLLLVMLAYFKYNAFKQNKETRGSLIRNLINPVCVLAAGVVLPVLVTVIYFWSQGALVSLIQSTILRFLSSNYVGQTDVYMVVVLLIFLEAIPLWLFSVVGFVWCFIRKRGYDLFLVAWVVFFVVIAIPVPHFGRHFSQLIPAMSLLSGVAIAPLLKETRLSTTLRRLRNSANNAEKKVTIIFLIVTLAASFVPAIYFQSIQYPNTNFSLFNETQYYTFSRNWNEQQEIVNYIKSNAGNGAVFIHGWEAELYWLSGNLAPGIRWATSYKSSTPDITNEEYAKILRLVENGDFGTVILMTGFPPDEIMRVVPEKYFFVKNIGLYAIYSKYNAEGYSIEYSFIENFSQALQRYSFENGTQGDLKDLNVTDYLPTVEELTINNETRTAIRQVPPAPWNSQMVDSNIIYENISILSGSMLSFGIAMHPDAWTKPTNGVTFQVLVEDEIGIHEIFSKHINPSQNAEDREWQDFLLDLNEFAGKSVSIYFVTSPGLNSSNAYDWAYWSNPLLLESH